MEEKSNETIEIPKTEYQYLISGMTKFKILKGIIENVANINIEYLKNFIKAIENL